VAALCTSNEAREAALFGVVQMKVLDSCITEKPADRRKDYFSLAYDGIHDRMRRIVRSNGHKPQADVLRYFIQFHDALPCTLAHKDGTRCLVWGVSGLMHVGQQEQFFADLCIDETDTTWKARFLFGHYTLSVKAGKLFVRKTEERLERF